MDKLNIYVCENYFLEFKKIFENNQIDDVMINHYPATCNLNTNKEEILTLFNDCIKNEKKGLVLCSAHCQVMNLVPLDSFEVRPSNLCFNHFANEQFLNYINDKGGYIIGLYWLKNWREYIEIAGLDKNTARKLYKDLYNELVFFDAGIDNEAEKNLVELSEFLNLPYIIIPVEFESIRLYIKNAILEWRLRKKELDHKKAILKAKSHYAEYAAIFDLIGKITSYTDKNDIILKIKEIFLVILGAQQFKYYSNDNINYTVPDEIKDFYFDNQKQYLLSKEENSITIKIQKNDKRYGVIKISGFLFPEYIERYLDFAIEIVKISGLVFSNIDQYDTLFLRAQYESLSKFVGNLDLGIYRLTYPELSIKDINNKGYELLLKSIPSIGPKNTVIGQGIFKSIDERVHIIELIQNSIKNEDKSSFEIFKHTVDGEVIFYRNIYQPLYGLDNDISEVIVISIDITKEEQANLTIKNALKIQDEIYANVSHELKTPLNVIFSANQLMEMYLNQASIEKNKKNMLNCNKSIRINSYRLIKLISNIVDLSKSKSGFYEITLSNENIVHIVEDIVKTVLDYGLMKDLRIIFDTNIEEKIIACDPSMIERVMLNLLSNAIKFSESKSEIYVTVLEKGDIIEISVKDTGTGIEKEHIDYLFDKFYKVNTTLTRNAEGSGLGLSLVKLFVELHDGKINVESEVGKGTTFKIELPIKTIKDVKTKEKSTKTLNSKVEMINIQFSDIYS